MAGGPRLEPPPQLVLEAEAVDRALAAMGSFADLVSPYLSGHSVGVGNARRLGRRGVRDRSARCDGDPRGRACPRPRPSDRPPEDLAEAGTADGRRMGAGTPASLPHRARPLTLAVPLGAVPDRASPSRAPRRIRLSPRCHRAGARLSGASARRGRRLPRHDRAAAAPRPAFTRAGHAGPGRGGELRTARPRRSRCRPRGRRPTSPASPGRQGSPTAKPRSSPSSPAGCRPSRSRGRSESRPRPPTGTSRTPTARSASPPAPRPLSSRWSTGWSHGENPATSHRTDPGTSASTSNTKGETQQLAASDASASGERLARSRVVAVTGHTLLVKSS